MSTGFGIFTVHVHVDDWRTSCLYRFCQVQTIGEYFTHQLLESRHRGAFELAYAGFVKMTSALWRFKNV